MTSGSASSGGGESADRYPPIAEYALLGDCHATALVSRSGSVDWACFRRFDAASVFGRLLDWERGGYFSLGSAEPARRERRYVDDTLVLETTIVTESGSVRVREAMAMREGGSDEPRRQLLRVVEGVSGTVDLRVDVAPRFDYGLTRPMLRCHDEHTYSAIGGSEALVVHSDLALEIELEPLALTGCVAVTAGDVFRIAVTSQAAHRLDPNESSVEDIGSRLDETLGWWRRWSATTSAESAYRDPYVRSAIVLKALTCAPTGAVVAAATTSLPERVGGTFNWDYRYSWVRDASLTIEALAAVGHLEVAKGFRDFLLRSSAGYASDLQIMYGPYGERRLTEIELDLDGWRGSRPVRTGNAAALQRQLDVYGHLLDAVHCWHVDGTPFEEAERGFLRDATDLAAERWTEPDHGIWEIRGEPRHYVYSKAMCWVALDRAIRLADLLEVDPDRLAHWHRSAAEICKSVFEHGVDPRDGHLRQHYDTDEVDASLLKLPLVGFVRHEDPRMLATVAAIERDLVHAPSGFVRRYRTDGGGDEGVFLLCSFWLVENLVLQGRNSEATALFERLLATANDVGLFAEQLDPVSDELLGNFPQAFTHLGLIAAARRLAGTAPPIPRSA